MTTYIGNQVGETINIQGMEPIISVTTKNSAFSVTPLDSNKAYRCVSNAFTIGTSVAIGGFPSNFSFTVINDNTTPTNDITIDPFGSETINNQTTIVVHPNESVTVTKTGAQWNLTNRSFAGAYTDMSNVSANTIALNKMVNGLTGQAATIAQAQLHGGSTLIRLMEDDRHCGGHRGYHLCRLATFCGGR